MTSCNKDEVIEQTVTEPPEIELDSPTGVYTVKTGSTLTIAPTYRHADGATYHWELDGATVGTSPAYTATWTETGAFYLTLTVSNDAGSDSEELRVDVVDTAAPVISLPIAGNTLTLALGSEYMFHPNISHSDVEGFRVQWTVNGEIVGSEPDYTFSATALGDYAVKLTASNIDGTDSREISVKVVDHLDCELSFPSPSRYQTSTDRYTFAGRPVSLTPDIANSAGQSLIWTVNGEPADCTALTFVFTPDTPGTYLITATADSEATASVKVVCVDGPESDRYRKASAASSACSTKVFEYVPAPGQFIGETRVGGFTGSETTHELACRWAEKRLAGQKYVSLGGFGGYMIVGFDHSIANRDGQFDFAVMGNAFLNASNGQGGSNEPGIVYVMQDVNGNGLPDDEWYELRGSETGKAGTIRDYTVTYYRPAGPAMDVQWTDSEGASGCIDYLPAHHTQDYYYPAWIDDDAFTLRGTRLEARTTQDPDTGLWDNWLFDWGYADNMGSDLLTGGDLTEGNGQRNGFHIDNAMLPDGTPIDLLYIDFVKIQTGVNTKAGRLGETSTEVFNIQDLSLMK